MHTRADSAGRLFIGVPVAEEARRAVEAHLRRAMPDGVPGRPVPAANCHLPLGFLGRARAEQLAAVARHLSTAGLGNAFHAGFGGLGAFPRARGARVLWVGLTEGVQRLMALARIAEDAARAAGFAPEEKAFKPHLTLSR